jgi:4-amino-4-deoxy-L-arabinose transferase-like glycosyltransferase
MNTSKAAEPLSRLGRFALWWIFGAAFLMAAVFALSNPPYEAPDEPEHVQYIQFIAQKGTLPNWNLPELRTPHGHHHPLYYVLMSPLGRLPIEPGARNGLSVQWGGPRADVPRYVIDHDNWPIKLLRLINALFAALTAVQVARLAKFLVPGNGWIAAGLTVAFLPQFAFSGGSVSNDPLTALLCTTAVLAFVSAESRAQFFRAGVWIGLALLAKKSGLVLLPVLVLYWLIFRRKHWQSGDPLAAFGVAVAMLLPLIIRNMALYGQPLAEGIEREMFPDLLSPKTLSDPYFTGEFWRQLGSSLIAKFGWMNVEVPRIIHVPYVLSAILAITGCVYGLRRGTDRRPSAMAALLFGFSLLGLIYYNLTYSQPQGRLLFPAIASLGLAIALGLQWLQERFPTFGRWLGTGLVALCALSALMSLRVNSAFYARPDIAVPQSIE